MPEESSQQERQRWRGDISLRWEIWAINMVLALVIFIAMDKYLGTEIIDGFVEAGRVLGDRFGVVEYQP